MKKHFILKGIGFTVLAAGLVTLAGLVTMGLWNWLVPALFGGPVVSLLQALGLLALGRLLFGRWGGRGHRHGGGHCGGHGHGHWKHRMQERIARMSPEERAKLRAKWGKRCGMPFPEETPAAQAES